jgi:type II secretory ATPase GspE/PulE/Tfp pilus assembly ATPase PilB-like protein
MIHVLEPAPDALKRVAARLATRFRIVPLAIGEDGALVIAMENPDDLDTVFKLRTLLQCQIRAEKASPQSIGEAIREHYGVGADTLEQLVGANGFEVVGPSAEAALEDEADEASIIRFVNELIVDAYRSRATDIHMEPFENRLRVRYRIDGILFDAHIPESIRHFRESIVSRIKIMANLDIAERRLPQDGRIRVRISDRDFDLRVSVIPIAHGESVNIRILQRSNVLLGLRSVGFSDDTLERFEPLLHRSHGIVLLTGPTGSGKTTTLYACLSRINDSERKILTIEDPVEYQIEGICQMQVKPAIGFTFASGLRSMLRHDPDVMLVGEIRDRETAELAIRCALTGHLVFSTLHTNDAPGAIPRLVDIGIEPYLLASSLQAIMAQRLVRSICEQCAEDYTPEVSLLAQFDGALQSNFKQGAGCDACRGAGYLGRMAIHELLLATETIRTLTTEHASAGTIRATAAREGMISLRQDGFGKAAAGLTTLDEVLRVTQED